VPASIVASATIRRRATLLRAMDQNCAMPQFRGPSDALWKLPAVFVPVSLPSHKQI
jgi:hypothetical protein